MKHVVVVGSGASGVHFAQSALDNGWRVTMLDVGRVAPPPVRPDASFARFKREHDDPAGYFLGKRFEGVLFPGHKGEYYGFPPHKGFIFAGLERFTWRSSGFDPLVSFARGGLAEAWTGGSFPFTAAEMREFPFEYESFAKYYGLIAGRIGINGAVDDLARFLPGHEHLAPGLKLDQHSQALLERYERVKGKWSSLGLHLGRSRGAVRGDDRDGRNGCSYLGRCLWACPREALYTPSITLRELVRREGFAYLDGRYATHFEASDANTVKRVHFVELASGRAESLDTERLVFAAGTLASSKLYLDSMRRIGGNAPTLTGLMDNRQVLVPFVNFSMLRKRVDPDSYQYHQLALGLERTPAEHYVHGLITTLKTSLIHPIVQSVPFDLRSALWIFRNAHAALGLLNVNFHDERREDCSLALEESRGESRLVVHYAPSKDEPQRMRETLGIVRSGLKALGCIVPPGMTHVRPMGASVHYAGVLPMRTAAGANTSSPDGESHAIRGLYFVDGTTFPFLPSKNLTFSLMANAARIADRAFGT